MDEEIEMFVDVPDGHLYCRVQGRGPDVLLLNPAPADLRAWEGTARRLAGRARVIRFDYRDCGLSSPGAGPYSEIDDIAAVLDAAGAGRAALVGVSDGGRRALAFAHRFPERVSRAVVVDGSFGAFPDPSPAEAAARREVSAHLERRTKVLAKNGVHAAATLDVDAWCPALPEPERRRAIGLVAANAHLFTLEDYQGRELDPPVKTRFAELAVPVSVLVGGRDFAAVRLWAERLVHQAPDSSLTELPDADHYPMLSAPADFERYLLAELRLD